MGRVVPGWWRLVALPHLGQTCFAWGRNPKRLPSEASLRVATPSPSVIVSAMETENPYAPPQADCTPVEIERRPLEKRSAIWYLCVTVAVALAYVVLTELILQAKQPAPGLLAITTISSLVASARTKDFVLSPLCCFAGMMSGALLAGLIRGWNYVQMPYTLPAAIGFSLPALILAIVLRAIEPRRNRMNI